MKKIGDIKKIIIENNFFRPRWYSVFLNPYFINRRSLYSSIKEFSREISEDARILDVGCGIKPYRKLFKTKDYIGIDIQGGGHSDNEKKADLYHDGIHIPFLDNSFDTIICTQVLEHASEPNKLIEECARVLAKNGRVFISMPFIYPEHEQPYDFRRYTRFEHQKVLERNNFNEIKIIKTTGFFGTFGQIFVIIIFEGITFKASLLKTLMSIFIFGPIQVFSLLLDLIFNRFGPTMDYIVTAKKNND
jgi:SAM-dependent methyltransferase